MCTRPGVALTGYAEFRRVNDYLQLRASDFGFPLYRHELIQLVRPRVNVDSRDRSDQETRLSHPIAAGRLRENSRAGNTRG